MRSINYYHGSYKATLFLLLLLFFGLSIQAQSISLWHVNQAHLANPATGISYQIPCGDGYYFLYEQAGAMQEIIIEIKNDGAANLNLTSPLVIAGGAEFSITTQPAITLLTPGQETHFIVTYTAPGAYVSSTAMINIESDIAPDCAISFEVGEAVDPFITNIILPKIGCDGNNAIFDANFAVYMGSGNYQIINQADNTILGQVTGGAMNGNQAIPGVLTGPTTAGTLNFSIQDANNTTISTDGSLTIPDCPCTISCTPTVIAAAPGPVTVPTPTLNNSCEGIVTKTPFSSGNIPYLFSGGNLINTIGAVTVTSTLMAVDPVIVTLTYQGDHSNAMEIVQLQDEGANLLGNTIRLIEDCDPIGKVQFMIPAATYNTYIVDGMINFTLLTNSSVQDFCTNNQYSIDLMVTSASAPYQHNFAGGATALDASGNYPYGTTPVTFSTLDCGGNTISCITNVIINPPTTNISLRDPCNCNNPRNITLPDGTLLIEDSIIVSTTAGLPLGTVQITANDGNLLDNTGNPVTVPVNLPETTTGQYAMQFFTKVNTPATISILNGATTTVFTTSRCPDCISIPTMNQWGLAIFGLLILNLSIFILIRFRRLE